MTNHPNRAKRAAIARIYTRKYRDTGQCTAYVEWSDGGPTTEGPAHGYNRVPVSRYMRDLFMRGLRNGLTIEREEW